MNEPGAAYLLRLAMSPRCRRYNLKSLTAPYTESAFTTLTGSLEAENLAQIGAIEPKQYEISRNTVYGGHVIR